MMAYVDVIKIPVRSKESVKETLVMLDEAAKEVGLKINVEETKVMS